MTAAPHLLVIRRRYLGDIVLLGSFLHNLRLHWPDARLTVLTEPAYSAVLALNPDVSAALALPRRTTDWPAFLGLLRRARFTHVFDHHLWENLRFLFCRKMILKHDVSFSRKAHGNGKYNHP